MYFESHISFYFFALGMTPLHCAAISHSVTVKASSAAPADVSFQTKAEEKLSCVRMLFHAGASLLSQVL